MLEYPTRVTDRDLDQSMGLEKHECRRTTYDQLSRSQPDCATEGVDAKIERYHNYKKFKNAPSTGS
jgi:hypothetical protein